MQGAITYFNIVSFSPCRFASVRNTQQGKLEERMPFFSFVLPKWFDRKYLKMASNMRKNTKRLTTPFDIYSTLMSVLHRDGQRANEVNKRSISLFNEVILLLSMHFGNCCILSSVNVYIMCIFSIWEANSYFIIL